MKSLFMHTAILTFYRELIYPKNSDLTMREVIDIVKKGYAEDIFFETNDHHSRNRVQTIKWHFLFN